MKSNVRSKQEFNVTELFYITLPIIAHLGTNLAVGGFMPDDCEYSTDTS